MNNAIKTHFPLIALAIGAFAIGTTEFSPMGFLPEIAQGLNISIPQAGILISAYALGVMIGAPLMTLLLGHIPKRKASERDCDDVYGTHYCNYRWCATCNMV